LPDKSRLLPPAMRIWSSKPRYDCWQNLYGSFKLYDGLAKKYFNNLILFKKPCRRIIHDFNGDYI
jgi:hypothetical protein